MAASAGVSGERSLGSMNDASSSSVSIRIGGRSYCVLQAPDSHNHGLCLWDSGIGLCHYLHHNRKLLESMKGKRVLEVGAGCGLVALVLAAHGAHVTATDLPSVMGNLNACVAANGWKPEPSCEAGVCAYVPAPGVCVEGCEHAGRIVVRAFCWGEDAHPLLEAHGPFDYIIGTDVLYSAALVPVLLRSVLDISRAQERPASADGSVKRVPPPVILFANEIRCTDTHAVFLATAARLFGFKEIPSKRLGPELAGAGVHVYELTKRMVMADAATE